MVMIAGHTFADGPGGRRCTGNIFDQETGLSIPCCRMWLDIRDVTEADIGKRGFAHTGALSTTEYSQILEERQTEQERIWQAVSGVAASRGS